MSRNKEDKERASDIRDEVRQSTSLEGMLGSLASNLNSGTPIPKNSSVGGLEAMEEHHIDPSSMIGQLPNSNHQGDGHRIGKSSWGDSLLINNPNSHSPAQASDDSNMVKEASVQFKDGDLGDLTPVVADILSFQFSDKRDEEINQLHEAVKSEMTKMCVNRVVSNTQKKVKCAKNFYYGKTGSLRVEFSILSQKYSMMAKGAFTGNEIIYPTVEGDDVVGLIMRQFDNELQDASSDFNITISKGWKE